MTTHNLITAVSAGVLCNKMHYTGLSLNSYGRGKKISAQTDASVQPSPTHQEAAVRDGSLFTASGQFICLPIATLDRKAQTPSRMPQPAPIKADTMPHLH